MALLDAVDASVILAGPRHHLLQGPWPTREHWQGLREKADALQRPVCVVNMHWQPETPPPEAWRPGDQHLWLSALDGPFPALCPQWVDLVSHQVAAAVDAGYVTYVHCLAGVSRSALVVAGVLVALRHDGYPATFAGAVDFIRRRRPVVNPCEAFVRVMADLDKEMAEHV